MPVAKRNRAPVSPEPLLGDFCRRKRRPGGKSLVCVKTWTRSAHHSIRTIQRWWRRVRFANISCFVSLERINPAFQFVLVHPPAHSSTSRGQRYRFDCTVLAKYLLSKHIALCPFTRRALTSIEILRLHKKMYYVARSTNDPSLRYPPYGFAPYLYMSMVKTRREMEISDTISALENETDMWFSSAVQVATMSKLDAAVQARIIRSCLSPLYLDLIVEMSRISLSKTAELVLKHRRNLTFERARQCVLQTRRGKCTEGAVQDIKKSVQDRERLIKRGSQMMMDSVDMYNKWPYVPLQGALCHEKIETPQEYALREETRVAFEYCMQSIDDQYVHSSLQRLQIRTQDLPTLHNGLPTLDEVSHLIQQAVHILQSCIVNSCVAEVDAATEVTMQSIAHVLEGVR